MAPRSRRIVWVSTARTALDEVVEYIARDSRESALKVLARALETAASLATLPERGRIVPELGDPAIRELFVHRYRLLYRAIDRIELIAGSLPRKQLRLVEAWAEIHQTELLQDWDRLQAGRPPFKIEPLR